MPVTGLPESVIETDHRLEGSSERASEKLAKHRWHWTLDETNPGRKRVSVYARAVGRSESVVRRHANGYALFAERNSSPRGVELSIQDAIRQADNSAQRQAMNEAIAEGSQTPVARVARGDNRHRTDAIASQARDRAERRGTDPVDEARDIAATNRVHRENERTRRQERTQRRGLVFIHIEGKLANAKRYLVAALNEAVEVDFPEEEMELLRDSIANIKAMLDLLDLRMAGTANVDWDAEARRLIEREEGVA